MSLTPRSSSSASGESEFSAAENIGVCACDGNTPESSTAPPAITELRIKLRRDRSCLFFIVSSVIQFDNTYFLQPRDNPFISCVIRSPTNLYALQYSRLRAKGTDKPHVLRGQLASAELVPLVQNGTTVLPARSCVVRNVRMGGAAVSTQIG